MNDTDEPTALQRRVVTAAAAVISLALLVHVTVTFLVIAPSNAVSTKYRQDIWGYAGPEFSQGWRLFAPELSQSNVTVHARAQARTASGEVRTTEWVDLTAVDIAEVRANLLPSETKHQLQKGWNMLLETHDSDGRPRSREGLDARRFVTRIALPRMADATGDDTVVKVQFRSKRVAVPDPPWEGTTVPEPPSYREFPWWPVSPADRPDGGAR